MTGTSPRPQRSASPSAPPPRLTAQGRATRARILEVASELMFHNGVARTSIPDVQEAARVSPSQIYHYFGDKDGLVRAVIGYQIDTSLNDQRPLLDHLDSIESLEAWRDLAIAGQHRRNCEGGCEIGSLASELVETGPEARAALVDAYARWEEPIRAGLRAMRERGGLRPEADPDQLALALLAALQGGLLLTQTRRDTAPLRAVLDVVIDRIRELTPA